MLGNLYYYYPNVMIGNLYTYDIEHSWGGYRYIYSNLDNNQLSIIYVHPSYGFMIRKGSREFAMDHYKFVDSIPELLNKSPREIYEYIRIMHKLK